MLLSTEYRASFFLLIATLTFSIVFVMQYGFGFSPCPLCLWQRIPWSFVMLFALCDYMFWRKTFFIWFFYSLIFLPSAALAFYHIGVERHFWVSFLANCQNQLEINSVEDLAKSLAQANQNVACDERVIFLFNFSFADWNFLLSLGLGLFALLPFLANRQSLTR